MFQKKLIVRAILLASPFIYSAEVYAAKSIDLNQQPATSMQAFIAPTHGATASNLGIEEIKRSVDFKNNLHIRFQQTYQGVKVWGADGVIHVPKGEGASLKNAFANPGLKKGSMDGTLYQDLQKDLQTVSQASLTQLHADKATRSAVNTYKSNIGGQVKVKDEKSELVVFVDDNQKAHWAYHVSFFASATQANGIPAKPNFIIDAATFKPYIEWDEIQTERTRAASWGGGYGGNKKMGKLIYDGLENDLPKLSIVRDEESDYCYLQNKEVKVDKCTGFSWGQCYRSEEFKVKCGEINKEHNNVYWNGDLDKVNGGYSPSNDALFNGAVIKDLYKDWYGLPVLERGGKPMLLSMVVHLPMDNAYWDGEAMYFGDGIHYFYPLTSLGVAAHEVSHGFTQQHSHLIYRDQSGGMNESFSDMAAQAAEVYAYGKNSWEIGPEIFKAEDAALRYMIKPSKDCNGKEPGSRCSIDDASQYYKGLDVHYSSGVYNRLFYLIATSPDWTVRKAFDVMVHANSDYWTSSSTFVTGACGILKATKDLGYNTDDVLAALKTVKIDTESCN